MSYENTHLETEGIYRKLQQHLDTLPIGFPYAKSGSDIKLLKHFFTPIEAQIATQLEYEFKSEKKILAKIKDDKELDISNEKITKILKTMAEKGSIRVQNKNKKIYYANEILAIGMYEHYVNRLTKELIEDFNAYTQEIFAIEFVGTKIPQKRIIPIQKSLSHELRVPTYDEITKIIERSEGPYSLQRCICRYAKDIIGEPCQQTELRENCVHIGENARMYINNGWGKEITKTKALEILKKNQEEGLIFQVENSKEAETICSCCGCCCGIIANLKKIPRPTYFVVSNFYAEIDSNKCITCCTCLNNCQMNAIKKNDEFCEIILKRCVGCGNCVVICPENAINLSKKANVITPPENSKKLYQEISRVKKNIKNK